MSAPSVPKTGKADGKELPGYNYVGHDQIWY